MTESVPPSQPDLEIVAPYKSLLIEVTGTPHLFQYDCVDLAGDVLREYGINDPRPRIPSALGCHEFSNVFGGGSKVYSNLVNSAVSLVSRVYSTRGESASLAEARQRLKKTHAQTLSVATTGALREFTDRIFRNLTAEQGLKVTENASTLRNTQVDFVHGGLFALLVLGEMVRMQGIVGSEELGNFYERILHNAYQEDLVIVLLISPDELPRILPNASIIDYKLRHMFNILAQPVAQMFSQSFPNIEIIDLREASRYLSNEKELVLCISSNILARLIPFVPEMSSDSSRSLAYWRL